ncbi:integrin alpha-3-like isoform X2 [Mugil cephalus]|uniref:integrin alpha-3-like isoform X2 n=1 Tax=Mugil cephalus TaxID=48193 RepID=UPI001FB7B2C4|nr:integrin alpha-3-like isoform X2 [Mugil cephalus]
MATGAYVLLSAAVGVCVAFNLDTSFPLLKTGENGSLFGLSVALHQDLRTDGYLLLVGAPREKAEPNVQANRTGGVYGCPINADQSDCRRIALIDSDLDVSNDLVEDMWLGVSVASQGRPGGRVLACGHRFVKLYGASKLRQMIGQCYVRGTDLQYDANDRQWQNPYQPCNHQADISKEVMCNMGISAFMTQTEVIVGSPGSYEWQGNVHILWKNPNDEFDTREAVLSSLERRNIYIGYSVTQAARLLSPDVETVVTGAPKDSKEDARGSVLLVVKHSSELTIQQTLRGQQTGSYFGNAVATVDLNNDGWNDLIVGAPFYFHRQREEGGAAYVYMNTGGRFDSEPSVVLKGPAGSAFGMAVASAADLNQDGFQDFAVGAPFHETGSVMIFTGSSGGISTKPSQVIQGSSVSPRFRTFGYSLSAGLDVDGNKYPDLLVGSLDDTVALLRSRPVIYLNKTIRVSPSIVDPNSCNFCVQVEVCFSYLFSSGDKSDRDNITVHFTVAADVTSLKPRLRFQDNKQNVYSGFLSMPKKHCETLSVGLLSPIQNKVEPLVFSLNFSLYEMFPEEKNPVQDLKHFPVLSQTPQPIKTEIHIQKACGSDNRCHSNLQMAAQFTDKDHKPFAEEQGTQVLHYNASITELLLEINVSNTPSPGRQAEDAHNTVLSIDIPPSLLYGGVRTQPNDTVVACSAKDAVLLCELGNPFRSNHQVKVFIAFQSSEISLDTKEIRSLLQLSTHSEQSDLSPVSVSMFVKYTLQTSLLLKRSPGRTSFGGHVIGESAMNKTEDIGSLLLFVLEVHIQGKPLGHLGHLEVEFKWPMETTNGKWLLYLTEIQVNGTSEHHCAPSGDVINPLKFVISKEERRKKMRRSLGEEEVVRNEEQREKALPVQLRGQKKKTFTLDCDHGAKCKSFACPLVNMNNSAYLTVRARLWNSTMIEDYRDAASVLVRGQATLKLKTNKPTINMQQQSLEMEVKIDPELALQVDSSVPMWIIVMSALAGILLLAVICLLLWKCGFFKRASTRELYQAKTQKAHMKSQPSDKDRLTEEL